MFPNTDYKLQVKTSHHIFGSTFCWATLLQRQGTEGSFFIGVEFWGTQNYWNTQKLWRSSEAKGVSLQPHYWGCEALKFLQSSPETCGAFYLTPPSLMKTCELHWPIFHENTWPQTYFTYNEAAEMQFFRTSNNTCAKILIFTVFKRVVLVLSYWQCPFCSCSFFHWLLCIQTLNHPLSCETTCSIHATINIHIISITLC